MVAVTAPLAVALNVWVTDPLRVTFPVNVSVTGVPGVGVGAVSGPLSHPAAARAATSTHANAVNDRCIFSPENPARAYPPIVSATSPEPPIPA